MISATATAGLSPSRLNGVKTRVMLVDDSAVIRGFLNRILSAEPDMEIVHSASDGALAVASLKRSPVDVIVLDVEMPNMDGLTAIPLLLQVAPAVKIVMASTLTLRNASISLKAMSAGAADYLSKPSAATSFAGGGDFSRELIDKVRTLGAASRQKAQGLGAATALPARIVAKPSITLRPMPDFRPKMIAIGSSTGGPQALFEVLKHLAGVTQPIFVTQHMPASFTTILAEHITRQCGISCVEAQDGMRYVGGRVHLARGGFHMTIRGTGEIALNEGPLENYCRPSVDVMLRSLAATGQPVLAAILTGMGQDGAKECASIVGAGGAVIAQDEATSVVWGMPGAAAATGLCSAILPITLIGKRLKEIAQGL